jgi:nitroimidazol reductase NimA-like FMN-containing flavoprotein (pyridoxamine 5'-phosphate oxidase superfamily)
MFGNLGKSEIEEVLRWQTIGRIGCNAFNTTYVVPISYAYDGEYVYCHTYEGLKLVMMRANPNICFEVDNMENMGNWRSVIAWGVFEELEEADDQRKAIDALYNRVVPGVASKTLQLSPQWPFPPDNCEKVKGVIFRIKLHEKTGRYETSDVAEFINV